MWHKARCVNADKMECDAILPEFAMKKLPSIAIVVYKAYLRSRLDRYTRALQVIAAQRENDFQAERMLTKEAGAVRSKLQSL